MAKYLTEFDTYAEYSGATLSLPNVSLIKSTGEVYYKPIIAGATLGDVLMFDVANNRIITSIGGNWSSTSYPIESYIPIAVNVYPASQTPDGKNRYLAVKWADGTANGSSSRVGRAWGPDSFVPSTNKTVFNGREIQDAAELAMPGTTGNTQAEYASFYACSVFAPSGTNAGDWYLPSYKELDMYRQNNSTLNSVFSAVGYAWASNGNRIQLSTTNPSNSSQCLIYSPNNNYDGYNAKSDGSTYGVKPMISL